MTGNEIFSSGDTYPSVLATIPESMCEAQGSMPRRRRSEHDKDRRNPQSNRLEKRPEIGLEETIPASDPVAVIEPAQEAPDAD
jgi:hypothetical protein